MTSMIAGAHVDQQDPITAALDRDANAAQFFLGDPQGWKAPAVAYAGGAEALRSAAEAAGVTLYVHAPYVLNVATTNNRIRIPSRKLLQQHADAATSIGARALIVHGGHVLKDDDPQSGFDNWRKTVERLETDLTILIENTAGGDNAMARRLDRLGRLWESVEAGKAESGVDVGFCLDTCHAHAAGEELLGVVERVRTLTGRIDLVHLNDSRDAFGSGADRHANVGQGQADEAGLRAVIREAGAPIIVETPGGGHVADLEWARTVLTASARH